LARQKRLLVVVVVPAWLAVPPSIASSPEYMMGNTAAAGEGQGVQGLVSQHPPPTASSPLYICGNAAAAAVGARR